MERFLALIMCPYPFNFLFLTVVMRPSLGPGSCLIVHCTSFFVMFFTQEMSRMVLQHLISNPQILCYASVNVQDSWTYRGIEKNNVPNSLIFDLKMSFEIALKPFSLLITHNSPDIHIRKEEAVKRYLLTKCESSLLNKNKRILRLLSSTATTILQ